MVNPVAPHDRASIAKSIGCSSQPYSGLPRKTICSHLIWPRLSFLTTTTLTGSAYFTHVAISAISIGKTVADEGDDLSVGIGDLRSDRVRQSGRHGGQVPGQ